MYQVRSAGETEEEQGRAAPGSDERSAGDLQTKLANPEKKVGSSHLSLSLLFTQTDTVRISD